MRPVATLLLGSLPAVVLATVGIVGTVGIAGVASSGRGIRLGAALWPLTGASAVTISGLSELVAGLVAIVVCLVGGRSIVYRSRLGMAGGLAVAGLGLVLVGSDAAAEGSRVTPSPGDLACAGGMLIFVLAVLTAPHADTGGSWPRLQLVLDALAIGGAAGFALWQAGLVQAGGPGRPHTMILGWLIVTTTSTLAALTLDTLRELRHGLWLVVLGLGAHLVGDVIVVTGYVWNGSFPLSPIALTLGCAAGPLMAAGLIRYRPERRFGATSQDAREAASSQLAALVVIGLMVTGVLARRSERPDVTALVLLAEVLALMCLRECVDAALQLRLTSGLRQQAFRDVLTALPNRRALVARIAELETLADGWVVLTVDLDGFKEINDLFGHRVADDLLVRVAQVLMQGAPPRGMAARIGGDEFAVLAPGDLDDGRRLAILLQRQLRDALTGMLPGYAASASVGVGRLVGGSGADHGLDGRDDAGPVDATSDRHELSALSQSGVALRAAKAAGRACVEVYAGQVAADRERRIALEARLRSAVAQGLIRTVAQPIVDLETERITGFEALARWRDEELGDISPVEFITVAEENGLVVDLGNDVLVRSIDSAAAAGVFAADAYLAINVSPIQLRVPGLVTLLRDQVERHRVRPDLIVIEVTEAILVTEDDPAMRTLAELDRLGVRVAIDDFGTGYSALGYLRRLPVQLLKIDMSLTASMLAEPRTLAIVQGVVRMAHQMDIQVVMEGIEQQVEAEACRRLQADRGQGWLYGRPAEWCDVPEMLAAQPVPARQS